MEVVLHADGASIGKEVEMLDEKEIHSKELTYEELEEAQAEITIRSITVERFDDGSIKEITLSDSGDSDSESNDLESVTVDQELIDCIARKFGVEEGTVTYDNFTGVVSRIVTKGEASTTNWNEAVHERAREAVNERPKQRDEDDYHFTVRSQCVRGQGYDENKEASLSPILNGLDSDKGGVQSFLDDLEIAIKECSDGEWPDSVAN